MGENQVELKRATVVSAEFSKTFTGRNGDVFYSHNVAMNNGDTGEYVSKSQDQQKFIPGATVQYQIFRDPNGYMKIKPVQEPDESFKNGMAKNHSVGDRSRQVAIIMQSSLQRALEFHYNQGWLASTPSGRIDEAFDTAVKFTNKIIEKSGI